MQYLTRPSNSRKKFSPPVSLLGLFLICGIGLLACGPAATSVPPTSSLTPTPAVTAVPQPSPTSSPTPTPAATAAPQPSPTSPPTPTPAVVEKPAPIESVTIEVSATEVPIIELVVVSGLPNACYSFGHYSLAREGDTFRAEIVNLVPDDPTLACAEIYRMITTRIPLDGGVETCRFYDVVVNDTPYSVQAIAPNVRCAGPGNSSNPGPEDLVVLAFGEKTPIVGTNLALTLIEVPEDSRCPSDVVCVWAGRATVVLGVELDGHDSGKISLSIEGGVASASETVGGHTIELLDLEPYPVSTGQISMEEYAARVLITGCSIQATATPAK